MKLDEYLQSIKDIKSNFDITIIQLKKQEKDAANSYSTSIDNLKKKAIREGLFRLRLGDFIEELCSNHRISKDDLNVSVDLSLIIPGDAKRLPTLKIYDNDQRNREFKKMTISISSKLPTWKFLESITVPFKLTHNVLADGTKFRENLIYEKKEGRQN